ncbi:sensor histidine kinase [Agromyces albus]|uniref:sensor histidine kinase n=1 Tax=Agromyces albus TaxID=205332 RepID=UPI002784AC8A|nr:ATP-binding protein [Agromyces albus]MDQ0574382.1 two-component system sensor histidine kinase TrcS [Agromyces albus]
MTRRISLREQLVVGTATLLAGALLTVTLVSSLTLHATSYSMIDTQLAASVGMLEQTVEKYRAKPQFQKPFVDYVGYAPDTIIAMLDDGEVVDAARFTESGGSELDRAQLDAVESTVASMSAGEPSDLALADFGSLRGTIVDDADGTTYFVAASTAAAQDAALANTVANVAITILAIALAVLGATVFVRAALRPLSRVADAAAAVTAVSLHSGDVSVPHGLDARDITDQTEVGRVGHALDLLLRHVDDALKVRAATDRRMRRFITDASHELRTPLASILGYAELTRQDSAELPATTEFALTRIEAEAGRMSALVGELLLLARLDEGQDIQSDEVDLADVVTAAASDAQAAYRSHEWAVEVPHEAVLVQGDAEQLHRMVANLLANAGTHTPAGTHVTVGVHTRDATASDRPRVQLTVSDDGDGIADELVPVLFERFVRGDPSRTRAHGSTGLGLAIVRSIVEAHDGSVSVVTSTAGTRFIVELPRMGFGEHEGGIAGDGLAAAELADAGPAGTELPVTSTAVTT